MNMKTPLAAALLMTATASFAEPFTLSPLGGGGLLGSLNNYSLMPAGPADDSIFTCGNSCSAAQKKQLDAIRQSGWCPQPATKTCTDYVMKLGVCVAANPTETIAAYTPPPDTEWASADCQRIPCRTKSSPGGNSEKTTAGSRTAGRPSQSHIPVPGDADFMGPVRPQDLPPAIAPFKDDEEYKAALKMQRDATPDAKIIEMGDRRFAVLSEDGKEASMNGRCSGGPCAGMPKPVSSIPGLQKKIDEAAQVKGLAENEGTPKDGRTKEETAVDRPDTNGKAAPVSAFNLGAGFGADIAANGGGGNFRSPGDQGQPAQLEVLKATAEMRAQIETAGLTYDNSKKVQGVINAEASRINQAFTGDTNVEHGAEGGFKGIRSEANAAP